MPDSSSHRAPEKRPSLPHRLLPVNWLQPHHHLKRPKAAPTCCPIEQHFEQHEHSPLFVWGPCNHPRTQRVQLPESRPGQSALSHSLQGLKCLELCVMTHDSPMTLSTHLCTQQVYGHLPHARCHPGSGDPWVNVTGRSLAALTSTDSHTGWELSKSFSKIAK